MSSEWCRIKFLTNSWEENKNIIIDVIKPIILKLERSGDLINFYFLEYYGNGEAEPRVTFVFFGNKDKVLQEISAIYTTKEPVVENYDPSSEAYRFGEDYMLGIKIFEVASKLALCVIDNKKPTDKSSGENLPIFLTLRHAFFQNLGYELEEELRMSKEIDKYLQHLYEEFLKQNIK